MHVQWWCHHQNLGGVDGKWMARHFSGGGGGQDPQKVISFDQFAQENAHS